MYYICSFSLMKKTGEPAQPKIIPKAFEDVNSLPFKHWFASPVKFALPLWLIFSELGVPLKGFRGFILKNRFKIIRREYTIFHAYFEFLIHPQYIVHPIHVPVHIIISITVQCEVKHS